MQKITEQLHSQLLLALQKTRFTRLLFNRRWTIYECVHFIVPMCLVYCSCDLDLDLQNLA